MNDSTPADSAPKPEGGPRSDATPALLGLLAEQRARWQRGERPLVEALLAREPVLAADRVAVLDLIGNETVLRQEAGEAPAEAGQPGVRNGFSTAGDQEPRRTVSGTGDGRCQGRACQE
jgi:hypothetical protein